ncbi:MAG TPA: tRNA preQ1(34) S-adenosylmethionine ribosyltransferase-isomerase QueA [Burkholderiales bacterium]|nr:tRNA preQ1(34) S-adenosylmethionine ribosyltransferase-isomerase QueA [Burkholderiales bacterium]
MQASDFDFDLPQELIAQFPAAERAASRMLYCDGKSGEFRDSWFRDLPKCVEPGDVLVLNDTRVIKARLFGKKASGGKVQLLVERVLDGHHALAQIYAGHPSRPGTVLNFNRGLQAVVLGREGEFYQVRFESERTVFELLELHGATPLPPYIARPAAELDEARYQTVYAREPGAVAAPTAGLHFDAAMLDNLRELGVKTAYVTLHIGAGTFQPVRTKNIAEHKMHGECYCLPVATVKMIEEAKLKGGRVLAVGSTSLRALEAAAASGKLQAGSGETSIFITPGYRFRVVERLLTNFHLPRSTLIMLVSAFGGMENIRKAYRHAVESRYRFFSYGDAMLIERQD